PARTRPDRSQWPEPSAEESIWVELIADPLLGATAMSGGLNRAMLLQQVKDEAGICPQQGLTPKWQIGRIARDFFRKYLNQSS
ncbi:hypothetical protein, partial [Ruegeria arenilitoris]|uniref:hypothetical protein n=1 Tax=Ruegeria arenilitoris TaxID=1173585 RepID=UPI001C2CBB0A